MLVFHVGLSGFNRFVSPFLRESGLDVVQIGLFFGLSSLAGALGAVIGGVLADRWGRKPVLFLGRALNLAGWAVVVFWPRQGLVLSAVLIGFGWMSPGRAIIAESCAAEARAPAFAIVGAMENLAALLVPPLAGIMSDCFGLRHTLIALLIPLALSPIISAGLSETHKRPDDRVAASSRKNTGAGLKAFMLSRAGRGALLMAVIWCVTGLGVGVTSPMWSLYVRDRFGADYSLVGVFGACMALGGIAGQIGGGRATVRFGAPSVMIASSVCSALLWVLLALAPRAALFMLFAAVSGSMTWLGGPGWETLGMDAVTSEVRAATGGLYTAMFSVGMAIGSACFGPVYTRGMALPFYASFLCELGMLLLIVFGVRHKYPGFDAARVRS